MKFRVSFDNSDPQHARVNPLRARKDKPHLWFEAGYWRVCPRPIHRRQPAGFNDAHWRKAQMFVFVMNGRIARYERHRIRHPAFAA